MADWKKTQSNLLLELLTGKRLGLVTDMDGTISPITDHPEAARVTDRSRALIRELLPHLALAAVVSGRAARDVRYRLDVPGVLYVGNHGLERWVDGKPAPAPDALAYRSALDAAVAALAPHAVPGMLVEDKGVTISVHYRQTADPVAEAERLGRILKPLADDLNLNLFAGRMVFELRPPIAQDKGTAFRSLAEEFALDAAVYLGDDTTDVAALETARALRRDRICHAVGVGVDSPETPQPVRDAADLLVEGVAGVEEFLEWLLAQRASST